LESASVDHNFIKGRAKTSFPLEGDLTRIHISAFLQAVLDFQRFMAGKDRYFLEPCSDTWIGLDPIAIKGGEWVINSSDAASFSPVPARI
jgi:hypothetical protein